MLVVEGRRNRCTTCVVLFERVLTAARNERISNGWFLASHVIHGIAIGVLRAAEATAIEVRLVVVNFDLQRAACSKLELQR